jgi:hypothetical protein
MGEDMFVICKIGRWELALNAMRTINNMDVGFKVQVEWDWWIEKKMKMLNEEI